MEQTETTQEKKKSTIYLYSLERLKLIDDNIKQQLAEILFEDYSREFDRSLTLKTLIEVANYFIQMNIKEDIPELSVESIDDIYDALSKNKPSQPMQEQHSQILDPIVDDYHTKLRHLATTGTRSSFTEEADLANLARSFSNTLEDHGFIIEYYTPTNKDGLKSLIETNMGIYRYNLKDIDPRTSFNCHRNNTRIIFKLIIKLGLRDKINLSEKNANFLLSPNIDIKDLAERDESELSDFESIFKKSLLTEDRNLQETLFVSAYNLLVEIHSTCAEAIINYSITQAIKTAKVHYDLAVISYTENNPDEDALDDFEAAYGIYEKLITNFNQEQLIEDNNIYDLQATTAYYIGLIYKERKNYSKAYAYFTSAGSHYKQQSEVENRTHIVNCLKQSYVCLIGLKNVASYKQPSESQLNKHRIFSSAYSTGPDIIDDPSTDIYIELQEYARIYLDTGIKKYKDSTYNDATNNLLSAIAIYEDLVNYSTVLAKGKKIYICLGTAQHSLGICYKSQLDYQEAIDCFSKAKENFLKQFGNDKKNPRVIECQKQIDLCKGLLIEHRP